MARVDREAAKTALTLFETGTGSVVGLRSSQFPCIVYDATRAQHIFTREHHRFVQNRPQHSHVTMMARATAVRLRAIRNKMWGPAVQVVCPISVMRLPANAYR